MRKYDQASIESIIEYASTLTGKCLSDVADLPADVLNSRNRGDLGSLVEKFFFGLVPSNASEPDFAEVGVELKTTGVKKSKGKFVAKERLVLTMIDYENIVKETWHESSFLKKCRQMLILFYEFDKDLPVSHRKFVIDPILYVIPEADLDTIKSDWEFIQQKVRNGLAHEISEGDTQFLGACRKGSGGEAEPLRTQPFSDIKARARAFSFKASYVSSLIEQQQPLKLRKDLPPVLSIDEIIAQLFNPYLHQEIDALASHFDFHKANSNQKGYHRKLAEKMLSENGSSVLLLDKAGIEMKTIRLNESGSPREAMSFPGFKYTEIIHEVWEDSKFSEKLEKKFLFVVFSAQDSKVEVLSKVFYWNMPFSDREEARKVWEETKRRTSLEIEDMPGTNENPVAHVRPKGKDATDRIPSPKGSMWMKKCFWLNQSYIKAVVDKS
jgi:DNA mismatch repair protein MutH